MSRDSLVVLSSSTKLRRKERPSSKSPRLDFDTSSSSLNLAGKNKLNVDFFEDEQNTYEYSNQLSKSARDVGGPDASALSTHRSSIGSSEDDFSENIRVFKQISDKKGDSAEKEKYYAGFDLKASTAKSSKPFFRF